METTTLTTTLPVEMVRRLERAAGQLGVSVDRVVELCIESAQMPPAASALDRAGDLVGAHEGTATDLAGNEAHLDGYGR